MLPLRDTIPSKHYPVVSLALIGVQVLLFLLPPIQVASRGFWAVNLLLLYVFGDHVENRLGHVKGVLFYLLCGLAAACTAWAFSIPGLLAITLTGITAGALGAYFIQYPKAQILAFFPAIGLPSFYEVPASVYLVIWILVAVMQGGRGGIALSGLLWGVLFIKLILWLPEIISWQRLNQATYKRQSPYFQVIRPVGADTDPNRYGMLTIMAAEGYAGTQKIIYLPPGLYHCFYKVCVPAGTKRGDILRLAGLGGKLDPSRSGDLHLKVIVD